VGVIASGPTYQWQLSQDGGTTWNNISGALQPTYSTPNLWIASDNGNKYRAIIYVECNGLYTTSAVATATLNAPVSTPTGVIMDDNFNWETDGQRGALPVTTTHSFWVTAPPSENLTDYPGPDMVGTPVSATSTLYLGYFISGRNEANSVPNTNLPVHLDVNRAIKVTLPFTPNSFGSHTNNGALRFGLFDYADGGVLLTEDSTLASGSAGNGRNVRGYMLSVDFGTTFTANSPLSLLARFGLGDNNLMGSTSDYISMGSGPSGGGYTNATAFQAATPYTLVFQVTRTAVNSVRVTATITGGGTNWTYSSIETNYAYHRFDAFGIRPNSLETSADTFNFPEFKVEVIEVAAEITGINITGISRTGNSVTLTWSPTPAGSFTYSVQRKLDLLDATWTTLQTGITTTTYTDTGATSSNGFYRVVSP
jgi:hypothetical protein